MRLDLVARSHTEGKSQLYNVTINTSEKLTGVPIMVTRPKPDARAARFHVGDRVAVGLMSFRVLPNFALSSERGGKIFDVGK